jgi:hypothetical protein
MVRPDKVGPAGRRIKNVNPKTRLRVVHGDVENAELVLHEDEENKNKTLEVDAQGVEHEDAKVR